MAARIGIQPTQTMIRMGDEHRLKIANSNILNVLIEHVVNGKELLPSQVTAGVALLKKVLPDLQSTDNKHTHDVSDPLAALLERISSHGRRIHDKPGSIP